MEFQEEVKLMDLCRACKAMIMFCRQNPTLKNPEPRNNPLDPIPSSIGNLRVNTANLTYDVLTGDALQTAKDAGEELFISHFVTCPERQKFKGKKRVAVQRKATPGGYKRR